MSSQDKGGNLASDPEISRLRHVVEARQKQLDDMALMLSDLVKKIEIERTEVKHNEGLVEDIERKLKDRDIEINEIQKEKEILFTKLQFAHKDVSKIKGKTPASKGFLSKVSNLLSFGGNTVDQKANEFIQTSKGLVKKTEEKPAHPTQAETKKGIVDTHAQDQAEVHTLELRERQESSGSAPEEADEEALEDEILRSIRERLKDV